MSAPWFADPFLDVIAEADDWLAARGEQAQGEKP